MQCGTLVRGEFDFFEKEVKRLLETGQKKIDDLKWHLQRAGNEENLVRINKAIANEEKNLHILNVCAFLDLGSAWLERINIHDFSKHASSASFRPGGCH